MDPREEIMQRLLAIAETVLPDAAYRNAHDLPESIAPYIVVREGDETADPSDRNRHGPAPRRVTMQPLVSVVVASASENVGTLLNSYRAALIAAICGDEDLAALTLDNRGAAFVGATAGTQPGLSTVGEIVLAFDVSYVMRPADLA